MRALITGSKGFLGKNLVSHLLQEEGVRLLEHNSSDPVTNLADKIEEADFIFHLSGANRPDDPSDFDKINVGLTKEITRLAENSGRKIPILFASSIQAIKDNPYGKSKQEAENLLKKYSESTGSSIFLYRLPNVFGKWSRPDYNSVVATFCHNIANNIPIKIHDESSSLSLVYIDDVMNSFKDALAGRLEQKKFYDVSPQYNITVGELANKIRDLEKSRESLITGKVGVGFDRALYATYLSYLSPGNFTYKLHENRDERGVFVEFLKTNESGQISFLTAKPGVTRGGHYHHTKTEKFLIVQGVAEFKFKNIITNEMFSITVSSDQPEVVETIPGWAHDIRNTGETELIVVLWANEIFDHNNPDTIGTLLDE